MRWKHLLTPKMLGVGTPNSTFSNPSARLGGQKHLGPRVPVSCLSRIRPPRFVPIRANLRLGSLDNIVFAVVRGGGVSERQGWKAAAFARA